LIRISCISYVDAIKTCNRGRRKGCSNKIVTDTQERNKQILCEATTKFCKNRSAVENTQDITPQLNLNKEKTKPANGNF